MLNSVFCTTPDLATANDIVQRLRTASFTRDDILPSLDPEGRILIGVHAYDSEDIDRAQEIFALGGEDICVGEDDAPANDAHSSSVRAHG